MTSTRESELPEESLDADKMELKNELFAVKLNELFKTYNEMLNCLESISVDSQEELQVVYGSIQKELSNDRHSLERLAGASRLPLVSELAGIQLDYYSKLDGIFDRISENEMDNAEKAALFAEYIMDSAMFSVKQAMAMALKAACMQNRNEV